MSTIEERGNVRAQKRTHELEARRLLFLMHEAGIPEDMLDLNDYDITPLIIDKWDKYEGKGEDIIEYITNNHKVWARSGTYLTIEGGGRYNEKKRDKVMNYCLLKAIIANFNDVVIDEEERAFLGTAKTFLNEVTKVVDFISILPVLMSYERTRFGLLDSLSTIPILALREIDPDRGPRENSDASSIIDSILRKRRISKLPTVLTFMGPSIKIAEGSGHGTELADIAKAPYNEENGIIRIAVKE